MARTISIELNTRLYVAVGLVGLGVVVVAGLAVQLLMSPLLRAQAEQVGGSPDSGTSSRLVQAYDSVLDQGHGASAVPQWTEDWGSTWNRIMAAASWVPGGNLEADEVVAGRTYFAGSRVPKTGTLDTQDFAATGVLQGLQYKTHQLDTVGHGSWTELMASGGSPASVTVNASTLTLASTRVMQDNRTKLIWTDSTTAMTHNNFTWVAGDDRANPSGNSCNFNATGNANQWCNVSNFSSPDYNNPANNVTPDQVKTGVSAQEFCLNLTADDGGGVKADWRVPTYAELMVAWLNGSQQNLPNISSRYFGASSESSGLKSSAWYVQLTNANITSTPKSAIAIYVRCVRV